MFQTDYQDGYVSGRKDFKNERSMADFGRKRAVQRCFRGVGIAGLRAG